MEEVERCLLHDENNIKLGTKPETGSVAKIVRTVERHLSYGVTLASSEPRFITRL